MPLTAFSTSYEGEHDVEQVLNRLSTQFGQPYSSLDRIPETWRAHLREDLQCPSCFVAGAEVVRGMVQTASNKTRRQSFFRFTTPGHKPHCDFGSEDTANTVPENLVAFGDSRSNLTKAVRELVCTGIELKLFSQHSIRDMREWFFNKKVESHFVVTLEPRLRRWLSELQKASFFSRGALPPGIALTAEIAAMPDFDWRAEAARQVLELHPEHAKNMEALHRQGIALFGDIGDRVEVLARRFQGRAVFDPTRLATEYRRTCSLAEFVGHNYALLKAAKGASGTTSVLAFCALLLFIRDWDMNLAIADFAKIASAAGHSNQELGNVMGLNPFHDYQAWRVLKQLQDLHIAVPETTDIKTQRRDVEAALRAQFGIAPSSGGNDSDNES